MLTAFDVIVGILVLISAILATARGLTREVLSLATWAGSAAIAVWMWHYHPEIARGYIREEIVADIATIVLSFIVSLIVLHLITMRIADFVVDSKIGPLDRTLGFVFGGLRGILIAVVIVVLGQWLQWGGLGQFVDGSRTVPPLASLGESLIRVLPDDLEQAVSGFLSDDPEPAIDVPAEEGTDAGEVGLQTL
ncbi:CvpA family protein [Mariluticola halotolerans]|uniref:CvpA family protein n=1 Tax=Mariluticola halotolerans TaxID=2909283 RepID=UPI0026E11B32|nr:CvpA family protein [Mariluticola halotolerans]UJQ95177.1 CvpA family protein [Mariluticola halotolerans]